MTEMSGVIFDVDGVLLDSLEAHLQICRDKSAEYGLALAIPSAEQLKTMIRAGTVTSPMESFFIAVGFPEGLAKRADDDYRRDFVERYPIAPFDGVASMLARLAHTGLPLGIVTSNTLKNTRGSLGASMKWFDERLLFGQDDPRPLSKADALRECTMRIGVTGDPRRVLYIGDQPKDLEAARDAGTSFLGVTYGWSFDERDTGLATVDSPAAIAEHVIGQTA